MIQNANAPAADRGAAAMLSGKASIVENSTNRAEGNGALTRWAGIVNGARP
jgi:hypothetical protein